MTITRPALVAGSILLITGCAGEDIRDGIYRGVYEGARIENQKEMSPRERAANPQMDYEQYNIEREKRSDEPR